MSEAGSNGRMFPVGNLHPISKLVAVMVGSLCALVLAPRPNGALLAAVLLAAILHGSGRRFMHGLVAVSIPFAVSLLLITAADPDGTGDWWSLGPLGLGPGRLAWASEILVRVMILVGLLQLYIITTPLDELHACLVRTGVPKPLAYALVAAAGFVPHLRRRVLDIRDAQTSRGVRFGWGSLGALSLVGPLLLSTLEEAADREATLLTRGFGLPGRATTLAEGTWRRGDTAVAALAVLVLIVVFLTHLSG